jgi:tetratricopeptide (TPR) repeat protein
MLNQQGNEAGNAGNWKLALELYRKAAQKWPEDANIQINLAVALGNVGLEAMQAYGSDRNYQFAIQCFEEALTHNPRPKDREAIEKFLLDAKNAIGDQSRLADVTPAMNKMVDKLSAELTGPSQNNGSSPYVSDSSVVDLTFLDPNKPIVIDPNVVKGNDRRIPVQPGSATPKGENYEKGFGELLKMDPTSALVYFKQAEAENPDNPLVRDAIDFASALMKVHADNASTKEQKETFFKARSSFLDSTIALTKGDAVKAIDSIEEALRANPKDEKLVWTARNMEMYVYWARKGQGLPGMTIMEKGIYSQVAKHAGYAMIASITGDHKHAIEELNAAYEALNGRELMPQKDPTTNTEVTSESTQIFDMMHRGIETALWREKEISQ